MRIFVGILYETFRDITLDCFEVGADEEGEIVYKVSAFELDDREPIRLEQPEYITEGEMRNVIRLS